MNVFNVSTKTDSEARKLWRTLILGDCTANLLEVSTSSDSDRWGKWLIWLVDVGIVSLLLTQQNVHGGCELCKWSRPPKSYDQINGRPNNCWDAKGTQYRASKAAPNEFCHRKSFEISVKSNVCQRDICAFRRCLGFCSLFYTIVKALANTPIEPSG